VLKAWGLVLAGLVLLDTTEAAAQARAAVAVSARVIDVGPSRESLLAVAELALDSAQRPEYRVARRRIISLGTVTLRSEVRVDEPRATRLVATVAYW
jgi:hypothetical protein